MRRLAAVALAAAALAACGGDDEAPPPPKADTATERERTEGGPVRTQGEPRLETVASGLEVPWELAFLPDGRALLTERPGRVHLLSRDFELSGAPAAEVEVEEVGEGGLLGLAVDPAFGRNGLVYLYRTTRDGNEVARYRLRGEKLREQAVIVEGIPAGAIHDGGRLRFGPDDRLYVSTGDAGEESNAQDPRSLAGKLLRLSPNQYRGRGSARPEVVSLGHRNPQGFDWQPGTGQLYEDEHGPDGNDEVNLIEQDGNYGWPDAVGENHGGFIAPLTVYPESIAPSGATFVRQPGSAWSGDYLVGSLIGEQVRRLSFDADRVTRNEALFAGRVGRIRTVVEGPDGALYLLTNNTDGRGTPRQDDDRVIRVIPPAG